MRVHSEEGLGPGNEPDPAPQAHRREQGDRVEAGGVVPSAAGSEPDSRSVAAAESEKTRCCIFSGSDESGTLVSGFYGRGWCRDSVRVMLRQSRFDVILLQFDITLTRPKNAATAFCAVICDESRIATCDENDVRKLQY